MAAGSEIRSQIHSIKNTQKITKAMQMVSTSKMRKTQARMRASRPYADKMLNVIGHLSKAHPEYRHPFITIRETKRVGLIVVSTDRGLWSLRVAPHLWSDLWSTVRPHEMYGTATAEKYWSQEPDSNRRPADYESAALPTELPWPAGGRVYLSWIRL